MVRMLVLLFVLFSLPTVLLAQPGGIQEVDSTAGASRGQSSELDTKLSTVYFTHGSVSLDAETLRELDRVVRLMKAHPDLVVNVFGHADDRGSLERMQELSALRAQMVKAYLIGQGISLDRIFSMGFGFRMPLTSEVNAKGRSENRRVEVHIDYHNHK